MTFDLEHDDAIAMLAFNLKLVGTKSRRNILVSAGRESNKERLLNAIRSLSELKVNLFATPGTSTFLTSHGVPNHELFKIAERKEPNIRSFLSQDRFDMVINILTGDNDYDESSDCRLIRTLCIENGIPLITDADVAIEAIADIMRKHERQSFRYKIADQARPWDMRRHFLDLVSERGGMACYHAHFDKAYLISLDNLRLSLVDMQKKWELYRYLQENYTHEDLVERISRGVEAMIAQGVTYCRTHVDAGAIAKMLPMEAALEVREIYKGRITLEIGVQPLQGVLDSESRSYVIAACEKADIIGGLPSRDRPTPEKHVDFMMSLAKDLGKPVEMHVDQENNPDEDETELLALKAIEHGLQGKVTAIHAISLGAKPAHEQDRVIALMKDAGMGVTVCPSAALSMKMQDKVAPLHNSIAPVPKLLAAGVPVYLGADNIHDLFMPMVDGDMWFEARMLMEACRYYDIDRMADIACDKSGFSRKALKSAA